MAAATQRTQDDASQVVLLLDVNPYFWGNKDKDSPGISFKMFVQNVVLFLNSILLLNNLNQVAVIAYGSRTCGFIMNSEGSEGSRRQRVSSPSRIVKQLDKFLQNENAKSDESQQQRVIEYSLLSGALSMALCYIQRTLRSSATHPQPRILCLQGKSDAPHQYVAVMNAVFSAQRSMIPIDTFMMGTEHSSFLQQAAHITGGIYMKPSLPEGMLQYLSMVFATDLHSRQFLQLPLPIGVDFRASCFCHKKTIDSGFVCSVCLSIFCKRHSSCSTCGADFSQGRQKRKHSAI